MSVDEHEQLQALCRRAKAPQAEALRAWVILACADGLNNGQISRKVGLCPHTVRLRLTCAVAFMDPAYKEF